MKPEEIDRLFRDELEKLDQAPGLEWNEAPAWDKISSGLKGGWNPLTWGVTMIAVVVSVWSVYHFMPSKQRLVVQEPKVVPTLSAVVKTDSQMVGKEIAPTIKVNQLNRNVQQITQPVDSAASNPADSSMVFHQKIDSVAMPNPMLDSIGTRAVSSRFLHKHHKYRLPNSDSSYPAFNFSLPHNPVLRLKVNNGLNLPNLIKSIEAGKNANGDLNYLYEYDETPPSFYENTHPHDGYNKRQIITNLKK